MSVFAVSDLHGHLELYKAIKEFLKPEDKVICLGDCGDRGPQPWETIKAVAADPQWEYLMGNHEHMLAGAMCQYLHDSRTRIFRKEYGDQNLIQLIIYNGGQGTLQGWIDDGADPKWINFLLELGDTALYKQGDGEHTIIMTHAGFTPGIIPDPTHEELLWSREHFYDKWQENHDDEIIVHGHTPCPYFSKGWKPEDGAIWYADGHKVDIDMGTPMSNQVCLLDLDTFDEHIFTLDKGED